LRAREVTERHRAHRNAGTCRVPHDQADRVVDEMVDHLTAASVQPAWIAQQLVKALSPGYHQPFATDISTSMSVSAPWIFA
jgi:hypothetical protein